MQKQNIRLLFIDENAPVPSCNRGLFWGKEPAANSLGCTGSRIRPCWFEGHCIIHSYLQYWAQNGLLGIFLFSCRFCIVKIWQYLGWGKIYLKKEIIVVIRKDIFRKELGLLKSVHGSVITNLLLEHWINSQSYGNPKIIKVFPGQGKGVTLPNLKAKLRERVKMDRDNVKRALREK